MVGARWVSDGGTPPPAFLGLVKGGVGGAVSSGAAGAKRVGPGPRVRPFAGI